MHQVILFASVLLTAAAQTPPAAPPVTAREPGLYGTMETTMGTFKFQLFEKEAPITVRNFVELCLGRKQWRDASGAMVRRPLIPGTTFHRVIPGFMIQGGDPTGTGSGDVGFTIKDEFVPDLNFDRPGRFGMANTGRPETGGSQFFITEVPTPHLNQKHTVFGQVTENVELVSRIARVNRGPGDKPVQDVKIVKVMFDRVGPVPPNAPEAAPPVKKAVPAKKAVTPATKTGTPAPAPAKKAPTTTPPTKK